MLQSVCLITSVRECVHDQAGEHGGGGTGLYIWMCVGIGVCRYVLLCVYLSVRVRACIAVCKHMCAGACISLSTCVWISAHTCCCWWVAVPVSARGILWKHVCTHLFRSTHIRCVQAPVCGCAHVCEIVCAHISAHVHARAALTVTARFSVQSLHTNPVHQDLIRTPEQQWGKASRPVCTNSHSRIRIFCLRL